MNQLVQVLHKQVMGVGVTTWLAGAVVLWIAKVVLHTAVSYRDYFPPNFDSDFLLGREAYFWGPYSSAFYVHILVGPLTLVLGTLLMSSAFRRQFPGWHRRIGKVQVLTILLFLVPSGLWMAWYAATGSVAAAGLGTLAIATALCTAWGWKKATQRKFAEHQVWMERTFCLLCSAVVIRFIGGIATALQWDAEWIYAVSTWLSWLGPMILWELVRRGSANRIFSTAAD